MSHVSRAALAAAVLAGWACAACDRRAPTASCDADLGGVYHDGDRRWMVLDHRARLEIYPLFPDAEGEAGAEVIAAPRKIELARSASGSAGAAGATGSAESTNLGDGPAGTLRRRYMQRAEICEAQVPVRVTRCAGDALELVLGDPAAPLGFAPCAWPGPGPSRVERWRRE